MSEQRKTFMQELDQWTSQAILRPIHDGWHAYYAADGNEEAEETTQRLTLVEQAAKKAIREKVLESFRNGLKAKSRPQNKQQK